MKQFGHFIFVITVVLLSAAWKETPQKISFTGPEYSCEYETLDGMYHGKYNSWYLNGTKRAEGSFRNNIRSGIWTVYDSTGRKRMVRNYKNNFEYELIFPRPSDEGPIPLLREPKWRPVKDSTGRIPYFYLEERAVVASKRMWRYVPANANHPLFASDVFYHALIDSVVAGNIKAYEGATDDEFRAVVSPDTRQRLIDTTKYEVIGYRLKEDWFFDKDRMISETRILGIMPVCRSKNVVTDTFAIAWFYFPTVRPLLAAQKAVGESIPSYIHTLDDIFVFRYFTSYVYKETNYYERLQKDELFWDPSGIAQKRDQLRREISLVEMEHDIWVQYSK